MHLYFNCDGPLAVFSCQRSSGVASFAYVRESGGDGVIDSKINDDVIKNRHVTKEEEEGEEPPN